MVKLVGVINGDDKNSGDGAGGGRVCLARRQFPLEIEPDLTMIMALDDSCIACGDTAGDQHKHGHGRGKQKDVDKENFLRNYRSLSKDEVVACLMVTTGEVVSTLSGLVSCVGCRRSVETLYQTLSHCCDTALEPLMVSPDGVVSLDREHIEVEASLANLFCTQISRLTQELGECGGGKPRGGKKSGRSGRCSLHSLEVRKQASVTMSNWMDTWSCMEQECREEVVLIPFSAIRTTLDGYLKKHSFCSECTNMVNKAYSFLVEEGQEPAKAAGEKSPDCASTYNSDGTTNLYYGISACTEDLHVHVKCDPNFIAKLFRLAEPELSNLKQERHAKTIEIAQKEVLTCIGLALFKRFQKIEQKLKEAEHTCDLLFLTLLKTLRMSLDLAAERKRGIGDLELLCEELEKEEKKKEGKRERKKARRARKKESKNAALAIISAAADEDSKIASDGESNSGDSGVSCVGSNKCATKCEEKEVQEGDKSCLKHGLDDQTLCMKNFPARTVLTLEEMLDDTYDDELDDDEFIPEEDIKNFLDQSEDMAARRQQLRDDLKNRFAQLCVKGVSCTKKF